MSGQNTASEHDKQRQPIPTGAAASDRKGGADERVDPQGGDDGALEHEQAEGATPVTSLADNGVTTVKPGR